jgi:hypothetical protein
LPARWNAGALDNDTQIGGPDGRFPDTLHSLLLRGGDYRLKQSRA